MLRKNDLLELEIYDMTNLGFGVAKADGMVVFVSGAVIGDHARVKIIKTSSSYAVGRIEELIAPSPERTCERCNNEKCQSCAYKLINYEKELKMKHEDVVSCFKKAELPELRILDVIPSPKLVGYRNKAQYPIAKTKDGKYVIGFYAPKTHRVTEARNCPLAPTEFSKILDTLSTFFAKNNISCYDEETGNGLLRHVYLRRGEVSRETMLVLVINGKTVPSLDKLSKILSNEHPEIKSFLLNINTDKTNVVLGKDYVNVFGDDHIRDTLCGVDLKLSAPSFYQVNHGAAELLYKKARELAAPTKADTVLDLYCGVGSIGLSMADSCGELIGIEIVESAVKMARDNAENAGFANAKFYTGDAADTEKLLENAERDLGRKIDPSIIILDPPRSGCDEKLIRFTVGLDPKKIVYISCNPQTLARDMKIYSDLGYKSTEIQPIDLFPATGHVESVVCLKRTLGN